MDIDLLMELGLSKNEASLYIALLELSEGSVDEIARLAGVRRPTAYKVLQEMVHKGLIAEIPGRPIKYRVMDPSETLKGLFERKYQEIERLREELPIKFERFVKEAQNKYLEGAVAITEANKDFVILRGLKTVSRIVQEYEVRAKDKIRGMTSKPVPTKEELDMIIEQVKENIEDIGGGKKSKLLLILEEETLKNGPFREFVKLVELQGDELRVLDEVPMEMTIYDDYAAMLVLDGSFTDPVVLLVQNKNLIKFLINAFDLFWEKARRITLLEEGGNEIV